MRQRLHNLYAAAWDIAGSAGAHRVGVAAAATALYSILAIVPGAIAFGLLAGTLLRPREVQEIADNISDAIEAVTTPEYATDFWDKLTELTATAPSVGVFTISGVVALMVALYSSSRVMVTIRQTLDLVFAVPVRTNGVLLRGLSAVFSLASFVLIAATAVGLFIAPRIVTEVTGYQVTFGDTLLNWAVGFIILGLLIRWLFIFGPHRPESRQRPDVPLFSAGVWLAALWVLGTSAAIGLLIQLSSGIANLLLIFGSPIIVILWLNTALSGLFYGAEVSAYEVRRRADLNNMDIEVSQQ
jgi:uncharacterized BrkB/YihY/UPF0761 family membrane protein